MRLRGTWATARDPNVFLIHTFHFSCIMICSCIFPRGLLSPYENLAFTFLTKTSATTNFVGFYLNRNFLSPLQGFDFVFNFISHSMQISWRGFYRPRDRNHPVRSFSWRISAHFPLTLFPFWNLNRLNSSPGSILNTSPGNLSSHSFSS